MNKRLIVTFTTTPDRIDHLEPVINNILNEQTVKPDYLVLYLPYIYSKTKEEYKVPEYLINFTNKYKKFVIKRVDDIGPITKIYYALLDYDRPRDLIISIDDDILLEKHSIEELLEGYKLKPFSILGFMGSDDKGFIHSETLQSYNRDGRYFASVHGLGGYRSILFPRLLVENDYFMCFQSLNKKHLDTLQIPLLEDDNYTSHYFRYKKIPMNVVGTFYPGDLSNIDIRKRINIQFLDSSNFGALYGEGAKGGEDSNKKMSGSYNLIVEYFKDLK